MWLEIEVLLKDRTINWQDLGFDIQYDFARRMIRLDEIYYLVRYANFTYSDILIMPTYERKYFVDKLSESFQKK
jgi:hypothetical protein